jgi:GNAT superfamily N-acetyltransferase
MTVLVRRFGAAEIWADPNFADLVAEYTAESATVVGMPPPDAKLAAYLELESTGMLHVFGAVCEAALIGFIVLLVTPVPHYGKPLATVESVFVAAKHRGTCAGLLLLNQVENLAAMLGAPGPMVSARSGSRLADLLERLGYVETHRVMFKRVAQ